MDPQGTSVPIEDRFSVAGLYAESSFSAPSPVRRDTMSTVSSEKYPLVHPGSHSILVHGNCSSCHHYHKAATIQFKVSDDPSEASHAQCENCGRKWLAIGGRNTTQTSLLSTLTTVPDNDENELRYTLYGIVRSATTVALPAALASVPEALSSVPSRGNSTGPPDHEAQERIDSESRLEASDPIISPRKATNQDTGPTLPTIKRQSTRKELLSNNVRLTKILIRDLKRKLRDHFPVLEKVHLTKFIRSGPRKAVSGTMEQPPMTEYSQKQGPLSGPECPTSPTAEPDFNDKGRSTPKDANDVCTPLKSIRQAIEDARNFDLEAIRKMGSEQRAFWIRERITASKCRCSRQCACKHRRHSSSITVESTQLSLLPPRRHSFEGIGSHLDNFAAGEFFTGTRSLTISATRTSEADTIVENNTIPSSSQTSGIDFAQRQRQRSWSPRPASLVLNRQSLQYLRQVVPRNSMDSVISGGAGRSSSRGGRRGPDRRSLVSVAPPPIIPSRSDSPEVTSQEGQTVSNGVETPHALRETSTASTPTVNGYLTDDERNRTSESTPPADTPRS
jgi:hypothetical protein